MNESILTIILAMAFLLVVIAGIAFWLIADNLEAKSKNREKEKW